MSVNYLCRQFHTLLNEKKFEDINNQIISKFDFNYLTSLENNPLQRFLMPLQDNLKTYYFFLEIKYTITPAPSKIGK